MPTKTLDWNLFAKQKFSRETVFMQLYNEEVHDLLSSDQTKLQIHESKESGIYVAGLREDIVTSAEHVLQLLYSGEKLRHFGETKMNKTSSRSHTIFRMVGVVCFMLCCGFAVCISCKISVQPSSGA